jgi:hypothetical protein
MDGIVQADGGEFSTLQPNPQNLLSHQSKLLILGSVSYTTTI